MIFVEEQTPTVGQTVRAYNIPGADQYHNQTCIVTHADTTSITGEFKSIQKPDDTVSLGFTWWSPVFAPGDQVTINQNGHTFNGRTGTIDRVDSMNSNHFWVIVNGTDNCVHADYLIWQRSSDPAEPVTFSPIEFSLGRDNVTVPADAGVQELRDIIERLSNDLADSKQLAEQRLDSVNAVDRKFRESIETIGQHLMKEAENRGWCNEYDEFVKEVNEALPSYELPMRERDFNVTWTETYIVSVERSTTVTASSEDEAHDMARDNVGDSMTEDIVEAVRRGYCEYDYGNDPDLEVEEA